MSSSADVVAALRDLVADKSSLDNPDFHTLSMSLIAQLKAQNRAANFTTHGQKELTAVARQKMDQSHLDLQNLLYERRHLEREIEKCRQFASVYQDIVLHNVDEFQSLAPEELKTADNDHQLMLNRLQFELNERQRLDQKRKALVQEKEELLKQSKSNTQALDGVSTQIDALMKMAAEIQKKVSTLTSTTAVVSDNSTMAT